MRHLGQEHVTPARIAHLKRTLPTVERRSLIKDIKLAPIWMHQNLRELAEDRPMKLNFLQLPSEDRKPYIEEAAGRRGLSPVILEKDFWVCWLLHVLFDATFHEAIVFKGGTSLLEGVRRDRPLLRGHRPVVGSRFSRHRRTRGATDQ